MKTLVNLLLILVLAAAPVAGMDDGEWFAVSGVSFVEAVGSGENYLLIARDGSGEHRILESGDAFAPGMLVEKIGSMQVMVSRNGGQERSAAPILRQQVPADLLVAAICRLYNQNLIIAGEIDTMVVFSPGLLAYEQELPGLMESLGYRLEKHEKTLLIRKGQATRAMPEPAGGDETSYTALKVRAALAGLAADVEEQTGLKLEATGADTRVTVHSADLSPRQLAGYLAAALDAEVVLAEPPAAQTAAAPAPAEGAEVPAPPAGDAVEQAFQKCLEVARAGDYPRSAKMLLRVLQLRPEAPPKVSNLLGKLLWSLGHKEHARRAWMRSLKQDPADGFARKALERIEGRS